LSIVFRILFVLRAKCSFVTLNHIVGQLVVTTVLTILSQLSQQTPIIRETALTTVFVMKMKRLL
jgi:hypothetical protein